MSKTPHQKACAKTRYSRLTKGLTVLMAAALLSACGLLSSLGLGPKDDKDEDLLKLLMLGALLQPTASASCENNSGFVICIPKGVTFQ